MIQVPVQEIFSCNLAQRCVGIYISVASSHPVCQLLFYDASLLSTWFFYISLAIPRPELCSLPRHHTLKMKITVIALALSITAAIAGPTPLQARGCIAGCTCEDTNTCWCDSCYISGWCQWYDTNQACWGWVASWLPGETPESKASLSHLRMSHFVRCL